MKLTNLSFGVNTYHGEAAPLRCMPVSERPKVELSLAQPESTKLLRLVNSVVKRLAVRDESAQQLVAFAIPITQGIAISQKKEGGQPFGATAGAESLAETNLKPFWLSYSVFRNAQKRALTSSGGEQALLARTRKCCVKVHQFFKNQSTEAEGA